MISAILLLSLAGTKVETAKMFVDKGSTYFRTDNKKVLTVGAELVAVVDPDGAKTTGKVVIMEVTGKLARVSLDDEAAKGGAKYVIVPKLAGGSAAMPAAPAAPKPSTAPKLNGKLTSGALRVEWTNNTDQSWTQCKLVRSDASYYDVGEVVKHTDDGVMKLKFSSGPTPAYDHVAVKCAEGESRFYFDRPQAPQGSLKGYATNEGSGGIMLYNQNDTAWTGCDVRKPDGTHFVLGNLKGHASDSVAGGRFKKEESNAPKWIELRCTEGVLHAAL